VGSTCKQHICGKRLLPTTDYRWGVPSKIQYDSPNNGHKANRQLQLAMSTMGKKRPKQKLRVVKALAPEPLSTAELEGAESTLARLVALAYCADHPSLFGAQQGGAEDAQAVQVPVRDGAPQPVGAEAAPKKVLQCAPRGQAGNERTFARSA